MIDWRQRAYFGVMIDPTYQPTFHSGVVFANRFFVIGSRADGNYNEIPTIWSSADGLNWETATVPDPGLFSHLVAGPGALLAVGDPNEQNTPLWLTYDGNTWQKVTGNDFGGQRITRAGATDAGFVAFAGSLWTSPDGLTWTESTSDSGFTLSNSGVLGLARAGDRLVALAGGAGGPISVWESTNLLDWTQVTTLPHSRNIYAPVIASGPLGWIVAGSTDPGEANSVHRMWQSSDGATWQEVPSAVGTVRDIFVDAAGFIAVGFVITAQGCAMDESEFQGLTWTSLDGRTWSEMPKADFVSKRIDQLFRNARTLIGLGLVYDYDAGLASEGSLWTFRLPPRAPSGPGPTPEPTPTPDDVGCG